MRSAAIVLAALIGSVLPAHASEDAKEQLFPQSSIEDAIRQFPSYQKQLFSFDFDELEFTTVVPADAKVDLVPMGPYDPKKQFGKVMNTAGVDFAVDGSAVRGAVTAFTLVQTAEAPAFCNYLARVRGFDIERQTRSTDLTEAQIYAVGNASGGGKKAMIGRCLVRGHSGLAFLFSYGLAADADAGLEKDALAAEIMPILSAMTFSDGKPVGFWPEMGSVDVVFAGRKRSWIYPPEWSVAVNDDHGDKGTEFMLTKKSTKDGSLNGFIWLMEKNNFDASDFNFVFDGKTLLANAFKEQTSGTASLMWTSLDDAPSFSSPLQIAKRFGFLVLDADDKLSGLADGRLALRGSTLFVSLSFIDQTPALDLSAFFNRLPMQTAVDLLDVQIHVALMDAN